MMAALAGCSAASLERRLARLVNDQELPGDVRLAVAQKALPEQTRRPARRAKSELAAKRRARRPSPSASGEPRPVEACSAATAPVETITGVALDALFGIVCDANAQAGARRKAAGKLAAYFLPKMPVNKRWRFTADDCGFAINAEIARDYRAIDFELRALKWHRNRDFPEIAQRIAKLEARRAAIHYRLKCPDPTRYDRKAFWRDRFRLLNLANKREAGFALTAEEDAEEAHRKARSECYAESPEQRKRFFEEQTPPPPSKLRPATPGDPDSIEDFVEYAEVPRHCIMISGQPRIFTDELPPDLQPGTPGDPTASKTS
jgi:hypothetical protein